jgi:aldose sugar dehydrogenase
MTRANAHGQAPGQSHRITTDTLWNVPTDPCVNWHPNPTHSSPEMESYVRIASFSLAAVLLSFLLVAASACSDDVVTEFDGTPERTDRPDRSDYPVYESEEADFHVVTVAEGLAHPWGIAWLPDGRMLVTERPGRLVVFDGDQRANVSGLPDINADGQGGLLDVQVHPNGEWIYYSYSSPCGGGNTATAIDRARIDGTSLVDRETIYRAEPCHRPGRHYGSRIVFPGDGTILFSIGDRGQQDLAQDMSDPTGSTLRINEDGSIPTDSPFGDDGAPGLYTMGNRNAQGMVIHPETGTVWQHEHGPQGGDELNIIRPGVNYGWPRQTHGVQYRSGAHIGDPVVEGMEQPVIHWTPSIAPSGLAYYDGDAFPEWRGNLFVGALAHQHVRRLVLDGETVTHQEELLRNEIGRVRDVRTGPDGYIYIATDSPEGAIYRLEPTQ